MKSTNLFIALAVVLFVSACSQDREEVADVAEKAAEISSKVTDATEAPAETFATSALINPNTASADVIATIPGISLELAQRVIANRLYATPSELHAIIKDDVDDNELRTVYSALFVKVNLNTGSSADYQLIPTTMSPRRLAHEFEEYRPYTSMEQFRREMSKYVSAEEVAFLERYVTIN